MSTTIQITVPFPSRWRKAGPRERYADIVRRHGAPAGIVNEPRGLAYWYPDPLSSAVPVRYSRIEMRDQALPHGDHFDFLTNTLGDIGATPAQECELRKISPSIAYDPLAKELSARCHFEGANAATLYLGLLVLLGELTGDEAAARYKPTIERTAKSAAELEKIERALSGARTSLAIATDPRREAVDLFDSDDGE